MGGESVFYRYSTCSFVPYVRAACAVFLAQHKPMVYGPQCDLNNEDSVNGCHGQSQVWEFSVHGTDYKEIDYIRDKINLHDDEEGLIHLKIVEVRLDLFSSKYYLQG